MALATRTLTSIPILFLPHQITAWKSANSDAAWVSAN
jgi:hypothetical protein